MIFNPLFLLTAEAPVHLRPEIQLSTKSVRELCQNFGIEISLSTKHPPGFYLFIYFILWFYKSIRFFKRASTPLPWTKVLMSTSQMNDHRSDIWAPDIFHDLS